MVAAIAHAANLPRNNTIVNAIGDPRALEHKPGERLRVHGCRSARALLLALLALILMQVVPAASIAAQVKPDVVAGSWYPEDAGELNSLLESFLYLSPAARPRYLWGGVACRLCMLHNTRGASAGFLQRYRQPKVDRDHALPDR